MAKDPAVLFYYQDFLVGTSFFTKEQKGAYIEILCHLYDKDTLKLDQMLTLCGDPKIWDAIKGKFKQDPDGSWYNERAREEKKKRVSFTESRRRNRIGSKKEHSDEEHMNNTSGTSVQHMENENEDENVNDNRLEHGVDKNTPEGIMFRAWGKHSKNLTMAERNYLDKICKTAEHDIDLIKYAFSQSVKYGKKSFIYVERIITNKLAEKEKVKIKNREIEAREKKIQEAKEIRNPDPNSIAIFKEISESLNPFKGKKDPGNKEDHTKSDAYKKSKRDMERDLYDSDH